MSISVTTITNFSIPFIFGGEPTTPPDTNVSDELMLETPTLLITGTFFNPVTGLTEEYTEQEVPNSASKSGNVVTGTSPLTFIGPITISFTSRYPLKTYPNITRARNQIIGEPPYGYQSNRAEIRYNLGSSGSVHNKSSLYKTPITLNHNTAGSDNVLLNYKIYYKGKKSEVGSAFINIEKTDDKFYSHDENG